MAVMKDFSTNFIKALGLNQACMLLELLLYSVNMFIWIDKGKYITGIKKNLYDFSLFG